MKNLEKSLSEKKYLEIKKKCFCCLCNVKLTTVQIGGQTNKFPLTCREPYDDLDAHI